MLECEQLETPALEEKRGKSPSYVPSYVEQKRHAAGQSSFIIRNDFVQYPFLASFSQSSLVFLQSSLLMLTNSIKKILVIVRNAFKELHKL